MKLLKAHLMDDTDECFDNLLARLESGKVSGGENGSLNIGMLVGEPSKEGVVGPRVDEGEVVDLLYGSCTNGGVVVVECE